MDPKKDPERWARWAREGDEVKARMQQERGDARTGNFGPDQTVSHDPFPPERRGTVCPVCQCWVPWGDEVAHGFMHRPR